MVIILLADWGFPPQACSRRALGAHRGPVSPPLREASGTGSSPWGRAGRQGCCQNTRPCRSLSAEGRRIVFSGAAKGVGGGENETKRPSVPSVRRRVVRAIVQSVACPPVTSSVRPVRPYVLRPSVPSVRPSRPAVRPVSPSVVRSSVRPVRPSVACRPSRPFVRPVSPSVVRPVRPFVPSLRPSRQSVRRPFVRPPRPSVRLARPSVPSIRPLSVRPVRLRPSRQSVRPVRSSVRPVRPSVPSVRPSSQSVRRPSVASDHFHTCGCPP